jgi:hypothetical protein
VPNRHHHCHPFPVFSFPDGTKRRTKNKSSTLQKIHLPKTHIQQTTFTTQSTTSKPQNHHIQHSLFPKTPAKALFHHKQKKTAQPKPNRPFLIRDLRINPRSTVLTQPRE